MALVMKQLNRSDEAIEGIKSFRHLCPSDSQESLDNILVELYKVEYEVEPCRKGHVNGSGCVDVKRSSFPMQTGGYVIYGGRHQHAGAIGSTLYGQDGRVICTSIPRYGNGKEAGNEKGFIVGMSTCYPKPGSVKILDDEALTLESSYSNSRRHSGVMGLFYFLVAEKLPHQHVRV